MADPQRVVATAGLLTIGIGSINTLAQDHKLPSARFLIGSGVAFLALSVLTEAEPDVGMALSVAVAATVLLGDGGGVLAFLGKREVDTTPRSFTPLHPSQPPTQVSQAPAIPRVRVIQGGALSPFPNLPVTK